MSLRYTIKVIQASTTHQMRASVLLHMADFLMITPSYRHTGILSEALGHQARLVL